jgi:hypothetical protein
MVPLEATTNYPCVDLYAALIMMDTTFQTMLNQLGIPVTPLNDEFEPIVQGTLTNGALTKTEEEKETERQKLLAVRVDGDGNPENGIQEIKEWQAFLNYIVNLEKNDYQIPLISDTAYGENATNSGSASRINP